MNNKWNKEIKKISKIIKDLSDKNENITYFNLHKKIFSDFNLEKKSDFIQKRTLGTLFDGVFLKNKKQIDYRSSDRGLKYTLDGVHLNSYGAQKIADIFYDQIIEIQNSL